MPDEFDNDENGRNQISDKDDRDQDRPNDHDNAAGDYLDNAHEEADERASDIVLGVHGHKDVDDPHAKGQ